ncbi:MAG: hypothetical protein ABEK59_07065 [Halobacteria archaeon]
MTRGEPRCAEQPCRGSIRLTTHQQSMRDGRYCRAEDFNDTFFLKH